MVLRIGLIIISNCYGYCNGFAYAQAFSQLISNGAIRFKHAPASSQAAFGRISSRVETQRSCILCQFVQICANVIIDIDGLAGGVIVDLVYIDGAQLGAIRLGNGHFDFLTGEEVGANGGCAAVIVVPRIQAGFHCIGLGSSIINRGFLVAVYLVPLVGHTDHHIVRGNGRGKNRSLFGGVAVFGVVRGRYGCRDTLDGGLLNSIAIKYITVGQQGVLISDSGNFAVGAAGEFYFGVGGYLQSGDGQISLDLHCAASDIDSANSGRFAIKCVSDSQCAAIYLNATGQVIACKVECRKGTFKAHSISNVFHREKFRFGAAIFAFHIVKSSLQSGGTNGTEQIIKGNSQLCITIVTFSIFSVIV